MRAVVASQSGGHVPQKAFGGHGHDTKDHARAAGHGQRHVSRGGMRIPGFFRRDGSFGLEGRSGGKRSARQARRKHAAHYRPDQEPRRCCGMKCRKKL